MFKTLLKFLTNIPAYLKAGLSSPQLKKANEFTRMIGDLLPYAHQAVTFVAQMTPNRTVGEIRDLLDKIEAQVEVPIDHPLTDAEKKNFLFMAAQHVLKGHIEKAVAGGAGFGMQLGGKWIRDAKVLPDSVIDTAVQTAYGFLRNVLQEK